MKLTKRIREIWDLANAETPMSTAAGIMLDPFIGTEELGLEALEAQSIIYSGVERRVTNTEYNPDRRNPYL